MVKKVVFPALALAVPFAFSLAADRALGWLGFPAEADEFAYAVAPPHYTREVDHREFRYTLRTNSFGLRSPETTLEKPPGVRRIVLLGDSFTEGVGVEDGKRWSDLLGPLLEARTGCPVEVINCAESGTGPDDYLRAYAQLCGDFEPDLTVAGLFQNDLWDIDPAASPEALVAGKAPRSGLRAVAHRLWPHAYIVARSALLPRRTSDPDELERDLIGRARKQGVPAERIERWRAAIRRDWIEDVAAGRMYPAYVARSLLAPQRYRDGLNLSTDEARARWRKIEEFLGGLHDLASARRSRLVLLYLPTRLEYDPQAADSPYIRTFAAVGFEYGTEWLAGESALEQSARSWASTSGAAFASLPQGLRRARAR